MIQRVRIAKTLHFLTNPTIVVVAATLSLTLLVGGCRDDVGGHGHGGHDHGGHDHGGHDHGGHDHGGHAHAAGGGHEEETATVTHTVWLDDLELFVEFEALQVGKLSRFAAHFTQLPAYKPVAVGSLSVSLVQDGKGIRNSVDTPIQAGIFQPALKPKTAGVGRLIFDLQHQGQNYKFNIDDVMVYADAAAAETAMAAHVDDDEITLLKEQAWEIDFGVAAVERGDIFDVINSSGHIRARQGDEVVVSAKTAGIVLFNSDDIYLGNKLRAGQWMFRISGDGLTNDNIRTQFAEAKATYEKAALDHDRAVKLLEKNIISMQEYDAAGAELKLAGAKLAGLSENYRDGAQLIESPTDAYVKDVLVEEGEFVENGAALVVLTKNKRLVIEAEVSQRHYRDLVNIRSANFRTAYSSDVHSIEDLNGRLLSYARNATAGDNFVPVLFEVDNRGDLLSGAFVEVFLKTKPLKAVLFVPLGAVMEDYENHYVYVQIAGESYTKREVALGVSDGKVVQVSSGLKEGDRIVTRGAYRVKMAAMSSSIPSHGHSH